jgi:hypothetical protein
MKDSEQRLPECSRIVQANQAGISYHVRVHHGDQLPPVWSDVWAADMVNDPMNESLAMANRDDAHATIVGCSRRGFPSYRCLAGFHFPFAETNPPLTLGRVRNALYTE